MVFIVNRFSRLLFCGFFSLAQSVSLFAQESNQEQLNIRAGITGVIGQSELYLNDAVRSTYTSSEYYSFYPDFFAKVGAMMAFQVPFLPEHFQIISDPSFAKYSYGDGNNEEQKTDSVTNYLDLDVESIEIPISLRYIFLPEGKRIRPFLRGEYSFAWFVDREALTITKLLNDNNSWEVYSTESFNFARFQDLFSASLGTEIDLKYLDFTIELVAELGDGIHSRKGGSDFMKMSRTTSYYLQLGVLF